MKRKMLTIGLVAFLLPFAVVCGGEKTEGISVAEKAFQLRLDGKSRQAKEVLIEYLKEYPDDAVAQFEYSRVLGYLFDFESAEKHAVLAVQQNPNNPRYHCWQGMCAMYLFIDEAHHKENLDPSILKRSIAGYEKAIELKPDYHHARYLLVNTLNNNPSKHGGDKKQARKHAECLMEMDLDYGLQAMMVVESGRQVEWKIQQYQAALAKESGNASLHAAIALLYAKSDQMDKSEEHVNRALALDKQQMDVLLKIAFQIGGRQKKYQPAKEKVQRYLELAKDEPAALRAFGLFYLAKIEKMSGNRDAHKKLEQMKQVDSDAWQTMVAPPAMLFEPLIVTKLKRLEKEADNSSRDKDLGELRQVFDAYMRACVKKDIEAMTDVYDLEYIAMKWREKVGDDLNQIREMIKGIVANKPDEFYQTCTRAEIQSVEVTEKDMPNSIGKARIAEVKYEDWSWTFRKTPKGWKLIEEGVSGETFDRVSRPQGQKAIQP